MCLHKSYDNLSWERNRYIIEYTLKLKNFYKYLVRPCEMWQVKNNKRRLNAKFSSIIFTEKSEEAITHTHIYNKNIVKIL